MSNNVQNISAAIKVVLQSILDTDSQPIFKDVLEYPSNQFSGFPSATILPADVQSDWATVIQNRRKYSFFIYVYKSLDAEDVAAAYTDMRVLVDKVLDALDRSNDLNNNADFLYPVPMQWIEETIGSGNALIAPIHLTAEKDVAIF